jgi:predicted short-subunit dehydrogenase-like oxidoreductase (DUF2520 family)
MGGALAVALARKGWADIELIFRSEVSGSLRTALGQGVRINSFSNSDNFNSTVVLIATGDRDIEATAASIAPWLDKRSVVMHTSGPLSSDILKNVFGDDTGVGSIHPLVSISDPIIGADRFDGAFFCVEGDPNALAAAAEIVGALGGTSFSIDPGHKPLYHASAVLASGHMTALFASAIETLAKCGVAEGRAREILLPLIISCAQNLRAQNPEDALTGPFARGDLSTIESHISSFEKAELDAALAVYIPLGLKAIELAEKAGLPSDDAAKIAERIRLAQALRR